MTLIRDRTHGTMIPTNEERVPLPGEFYLLDGQIQKCYSSDRHPPRRIYIQAGVRLRYRCPNPECENRDPDQISRWEEVKTWEKYEAELSVDAHGKLDVEPGAFVKRGDVDETLDWTLHCDVCDHEGGEPADWVVRESLVAVQLMRMGWPTLAEDIMGGLPLESALVRLREIGEQESNAARLLRWHLAPVTA